MKVTEDGFKDRQLHIEDYLQMVSAEQKEYAEVSAHQRITENNDIITDFQTDKLLEKILANDNLNQAFKKVKSNKGAGGVDGMNVDELGMADMKNILSQTDEWLRHKIRAIYWKQWKKAKTKFKELKKLGVDGEKTIQFRCIMNIT